MSSTVHRLSSRDGFSLEVPDGLSEAPELETDSVCLVAHADPWPWTEAFRPNLTAEVTPLSVDRSTIVQLSALTIAAQVALGAHVAACDRWPGPSGEDARRIISIYPAMDTTVVQLQYVTILGDRAVTVSVQHSADNHPYGDSVFRHAVASIRSEFSGEPPDPDPDTMPRLDPFAAQRGLELEYLGGVRASQPFRSAGPPLGEDQLEALRRGKLRRRTDPAALAARGLVSADGRLTEVGEDAHRALGSPAHTASIEVDLDDGRPGAVLHAYQRRDTAAVVASAPPGESGDGSTIDVIASQTTAIALARWLGLSPAWTFAIGDGDSPSLELDAALLDARMTAQDAPMPADANAALARMWSQPWQVARLRSSAPHLGGVTVVTTAEAGSFRLDRDSSSGSVALTPLPSAHYLLEVLRLGGFDVTAGG
jgi:hypothetical protein